MKEPTKKELEDRRIESLEKGICFCCVGDTPATHKVNGFLTCAYHAQEAMLDYKMIQAIEAHDLRKIFTQTLGMKIPEMPKIEEL